MVESHVEHGAVTAQYGPYMARFGAFRRVEYRRGPVRLVITASSPDYDKYYIRSLIALNLIPVALFLALIPLVGPWFPILLSLGFTLMTALNAWDVTGPERLEVDSRIVTVSRRGYLRTWGREQFVGVQLNPLSAAVSGKTSRAARLAPTVVWDPQGQGPGMWYAGGMGAGLSRGEAEQVLEVLSTFCEENPWDRHYSFKTDGVLWE